MRVTMKHQISGTRDGQEWPDLGEQIDLPDAEAELLVASGAAVVAEVVETATAPDAAERAVSNRGRKAPAKRAPGAPS